MRHVALKQGMRVMDLAYILDILGKILLGAPPIILAVTLHEVGHGWMARQLGDNTAANLGRLTPNPLKHIDPIGTILLPLLLIITKAGFLFGWAKPVPVNWRNLKHLRRDMALVAIAGPGANVIQALAWVAVTWAAYPVVAASPGLGLALISMAEVGIIINVVLVAFNIIPLPPLDGSRVVTALLPRNLAITYNKLEPYGLFIIMGLLLLGWMDNLVGPLVIEGLRLLDALRPH
jgi:Zn-dependent protease